MNRITYFEGKFEFMSNFFPSVVFLDGDSYPTVENAYQAAKTLNCQIRWRMQNMQPGGAKRLGNSLQLRPDWESVKYEIMKDLVSQKFIQLPFKVKLLETGDSQLIEGNSWHDQIWGACNCGGSLGFCKKKPTTVASNWLGKILMEVRKVLQNAN